MSQSLKQVTGFGLHLLKNQNETYSFVGTVPIELGYVTKAGNTPTAAEVESQHRLPASYRTIKCRVFSCVEDAIREAHRLGYEVNNAKGGL